MIFNISVISVNRLFPTQFVSTAYGAVNLVAHVFACLSALAAEIPNPLPFAIFECLLVVAAVMTFYITEVKSIITSKDQSAEVASETEYTVEEYVLISKNNSLSFSLQKGI